MIKNQLGKFVNIKTGKLDANASSSDGLYPFFTCSKEPLKISSYSYDCRCVLVAGNGDLNVKYYEGKFDAYQRTYIIQSKDESILDTRYLYWFLYKYVEKLRELSIGGVIKYIKINNLTDPIIPLPSIKDQKRIVKILDKANTLRQKRKQAIKLLDDYLKSVFLEMFGDPVNNPKGWDKIFFGDNKYLKIIDGDRGKNYPKKDQFSLDGHCLFLSTSNVRKGSFDFSKLDFITKEKDESMGKGKVSRGDLILTTRGTLGNSAYYNDQVQYENIRINSGMVILRVNQNKLLPQYLIYVINSDDFIRKTKKANSGSAQPQLPIMVLSRLSFLVPTIVEQQKFIKIIQSQEYLKQSMLSQSAELETQFQALMQKAFNGEL